MPNKTPPESIREASLLRNHERMMTILEDNKLPDVEPIMEASTATIAAAAAVCVFMTFLAGVVFGAVCTAVGAGQ